MPTDISRTIDQALEAFRLDDTLSAQAYEDTPPELRARLKTAIAFQCYRHDEAPTWETRSVHRPRAGFRHTIHVKPAAWTVAVIDPDFDSPARLLAALMPAVLAGVPRIFVVSFGATPDAALLVALELAGLEDVYVLPPCAPRQQNGVDPLRLLTALFDENPDGRLLLFPSTHARVSPMFADLARVACHLHLPVWQDAAPRLLVRNDTPAPDNGMTLETLLRWAHGNAFIKLESTDSLDQDLPHFAQADNLTELRDMAAGMADDMAEISLYDACYTGAPSLAAPSASCALTLSAGMEACWESLPKDFFRTRSLAACLATLQD